MKAWRRTAHLWGGRVRGIKGLVTALAGSRQAIAEAVSQTKGFARPPEGPRFVPCGYAAPRRRSLRAIEAPITVVPSVLSHGYTSEGEYA